MSVVLHQSHKLFYAEIDLPDDGSQGAPVQFFVVGNNDLSEGMVATQNHVTAVLPFQVESNLPSAPAQSRPEITGRLLIRLRPLPQSVLQVPAARLLQEKRRSLQLPL